MIGSNVQTVWATNPYGKSATMLSTRMLVSAALNLSSVGLRKGVRAGGRK